MMTHSQPAVPMRPSGSVPSFPRAQAPIRPVQNIQAPQPRYASPQLNHASQRIDINARFPKPARGNCINAWMKEASYEQILTPVIIRGEDKKLYYHALIRQTGVNDRITYENELFTFHQKLTNTKRNILILDDGIPDATP